MHECQPFFSCTREKPTSQFALSTRSLTVTANLAKKAAFGMSVAPVVIHIQEANARLKAAESPSKEGWHGGANCSFSLAFLQYTCSQLLTVKCQVSSDQSIVSLDHVIQMCCSQSFLDPKQVPI